MKVRSLIVSVLAIVMCSLYTQVEARTTPPGCMIDINEGGHLDTDYGTMFMAEWWYLNGSATLVGERGERRKVRFFFSPWLIRSLRCSPHRTAAACRTCCISSPSIPTTGSRSSNMTKLTCPRPLCRITSPSTHAVCQLHLP